MKKRLYDFYSVSKLGDSRGSLDVIEARSAPKKSFLRMYLIRLNKMGQVRGEHAHRETFQVAYCVRGSAKLKFTDGVQAEEVVLDNTSDAVTFYPLVWHSIESLSDLCEIIVMADTFYCESDYIRDFDEFLGIIN